jgi:hypothetical protein
VIDDATEGGALKRGTTVMTLREAIARYCVHPIERVGDHPGLTWAHLAPAMQCITSRRREAEQVEQISRQTLPLLEEIRDHLSDQHRVNRAIARIDELRARMNQRGACYDLIIQLSQTTEMRRFKSDRLLAAAKVEGIERQRRQVERDIANVRGVVDAAQTFALLMDDVNRRLGELLARHGGQRSAA